MRLIDTDVVDIDDRHLARLRIDAELPKLMPRRTAHAWSTANASTRFKPMSAITLNDGCGSSSSSVQGMKRASSNCIRYPKPGSCSDAT